MIGNYNERNAVFVIFLIQRWCSNQQSYFEKIYVVFNFQCRFLGWRIYLDVQYISDIIIYSLFWAFCCWICSQNSDVFSFYLCSYFWKQYGLCFDALAMDVALSPMRTQELDPMPSDASPMLINMTPTVEQEGEGDVLKDLDSGQQYEKPPPLHTGADWKIVLHLPEIETWLRMTSERVRDLTYSVQQDSDSRHVDVHLVQLKVRWILDHRFLTQWRCLIQLCC